MNSLAEIFKRVKPSTVAIGTKVEGKPLAIGTGFIVDPSGVVVTCKHVVEGLLLEHEKFPDTPIPSGKKVGRATLKTHEIFTMFICVRGDEIEVEGVSPVFIGGPNKRDLAVMKLPNRSEPYPSIELGDSDKLQEGDFIATCGFPLGLALNPKAISGTSSFQAGIVSAVFPHQDVPSKLRSAFQLDLTANPGNSGGPVFLQGDGVVIGVLSHVLRAPQSISEGNLNAKVSVPTGLSYAVPINAASNWVHRVRSMTEGDLKTLARGELPEGWDTI